MPPKPMSTEHNNGGEHTVIDSSILESKFERLIKRRILFILGPIMPETTSSFIVKVLDADFEKDRSKPVWIVLSSPGGDVFSGLAIYDVVKMLVDQGIEVNVVAHGMVASMAVPILQAGTKRFALPNAHIMIHQISLQGLSATEINQLEDSVKDTMKINARLIRIITERCGVTEKKLTADSKKKDLLFSAEEARDYGKHGLVDEVIISIPFPNMDIPS